MSTPRCRAKNKLTCRKHGAALAKAYFPPAGTTRNFGVKASDFDEYVAQSNALNERLPQHLRWELGSYTRTSHSEVNAFLRAGLSGVEEDMIYQDYRDRELTPELQARVHSQSKELIPILKERIADLDQAMELGQDKRGARVLYRSLRVRGAKSAAERKDFIKQHYPVGSVISEKAYVSTSVDSDFMLTNARKRPEELFVLEILSSRGVPLHEEFESMVQHVEREVLLPRNAKFEVLNVTSATYEASGNQPHLESWLGKPPTQKRFTVVQLREVE